MSSGFVKAKWAQGIDLAIGKDITSIRALHPDGSEEQFIVPSDWKIQTGPVTLIEHKAAHLTIFAAPRDSTVWIHGGPHRIEAGGWYWIRERGIAHGGVKSLLLILRELVQHGIITEESIKDWCYAGLSSLALRGDGAAESELTRRMEHTERKFEVGASVVYGDSFGREHNALVTQWFAATPELMAEYGSPGCNVLFLSSDEKKVDGYGRQSEHQSSVIHRTKQPAGGNYWRWPDE